MAQAIQIWCMGTSIEDDECGIPNIGHCIYILTAYFLSSTAFFCPVLHGLGLRKLIYRYLNYTVIATDKALFSSEKC